MKTLLIGGSGQLGTEIRARWTEYEIVAPSHEQLDLEDAVALEALVDTVRPELVVNCAAFHNVDRCEAEPERALAVNALAVDRVAALCAARDLRYVTFSTDYVFDGKTTRPYREDDAPHPISAYGVSKLAGELLVERRQMRAFVVRTCGVYGIVPSRSKGHTFIDRIVAQARAGEPVRVVRDVVVSPTFAGDLADAVALLVQRDAYGLYHAANAGPVSWYDFAVEALRQSGVSANVEPIAADAWKAPARRPAFSALENAKLAALGITLPSWQDGIAQYVSMVGAPLR